MSRSTSEQSSILQVCECAICFEIMKDPKTLECEHSFCKECLEGCVDFKTNSVPFIMCPSCRAENTLGIGETVSELKAPLILKQILDGMQENTDRCRKYTECCNAAERKLTPRCCADKNVLIEWYCWNCKSFFCKRCFNLHSLLSSCGMEFYEVKYSEALDSFTLFCSKHKAFHSHGCLWCASTFCNYCLHETHINVDKNCKIVSFKEYASKFKDPLLEKISLMENYKAKQKSIIDEINKSSLNLHCQEENIKKYIEERKIVVLSQMLFLLELTGKQLMSNFHSELKEYGSATTKMKDEIDTQLNSVQEVLKKSELLAEKSLMEIISQTKELQDEFHLVLPEDILEKETYLPDFQVQMEIDESDSVTPVANNVDNLCIGIQAAFGDIHLSTMKNDGNHESTERVLNTISNNIDYSSSMITKLNTASESRKYVLKCLKKLGLQKNIEVKPVVAPTTKDSTDVIVNEGGFSINQCYIKVFENEDSTYRELLTEPNDTLLLSNVEAQFSNATGLKFQTSSGTWQRLRLQDGVLYPPDDGWNDGCYYVSFDEIEKNVVHILSHEHPLRLTHRKTWDCGVCGKNYRATKSYFCGSCKYDACCECVNIIGRDGDLAEDSQPGQDNNDKEKKKRGKKKDTPDVPVENKDDQSDDSDDSSVIESDGQSSNQVGNSASGGRGKNPRRERRPRRRAGNQRGGSTGCDEPIVRPLNRCQSDDATTSDGYNVGSSPLDLMGLRIGVPDGESTTRGGGGSNNFNRGGRGGRPRGRGNMNRGGRARGRGQPGDNRGNRGGPNRGQPGDNRGNRGVPNRCPPRGQRGQSILSAPVAHQRPNAASSLGNLTQLTQCYRCGQFGHVVSNCPQSM